jgi:hypothetical protein
MANSQEQELGTAVSSFQQGELGLFALALLLKSTACLPVRFAN